MQASLARWAVVTFCMLGSLGCQGTKPGWWPGKKSIPYSQSSSTPPAAVQQQQYPTPAAGYMDQAGNQQTSQNGYPIGNNQQNAYGAVAANGANPYDPAYAQQQQQAGGAYPDQYPNTGNPYAQSGAAGNGYGDPQSGYSQAAQNPYGAAGAGGGYDPVRTADARQAPGAAGGAPGYGTNSQYDPNNNGGYPPQDQYNPAAPAGGYPQGTSQPDPSYPQGNSGYQPGNTGYQPGNTGYAPPGTTQYQPPTGPYADQTSTAQVEQPYRPGSTSDYSPAGAGAAGTAATGTAPAGYGQPAAPTASAPAGYNNAARYPNTAAAGPGNAYPSSPAVDRYGRPIQEAAGSFGNEGGMQR